MRRQQGLVFDPCDHNVHPMLEDRSYMRSDYPREGTSALTWILCATIAGAIMQWTFQQWAHDAFTDLLVLRASSVSHGKVWTLLTYVLLHDGPIHLLLNCLGLFFLGRELAPLLGTRKFLQFYFATALAGSLAWLSLHIFTGGTVLGASACVAAMFVFFACIYPEREITFLVFFVLPVTVRPKILAWCLVGFDAIGFVFSELPHAIFPSGIAHSAHLGGMAAGWLFYRFAYANNGPDRPASSWLELTRFFRRRPKPAPTGLGTATGSAPANLRAEVDRILDKINSHGFGALTEQEKRLLDDAKDLLSRH